MQYVIGVIDFYFIYFKVRFSFLNFYVFSEKFFHLKKAKKEKWGNVKWILQALIIEIKYEIWFV